MSREPAAELSRADPVRSAAVGIEGEVTSKTLELDALTESFDGKKSTVVHKPAGTGRSELVRVSCPSPTYCDTVGTGETGTLVETWDGKSWTLEDTSALAADDLSGISCTAVSGSSLCTAAGTTGDVVLGTTPAGGLFYTGTLTSPAGLVCGAVRVGSCLLPAESSSATSKTVVAESKGGGTWHVVPTPDVTGSESFLSGISCAGPDAQAHCTAVGFDLNSKGTTASALIESASS